jgi:hypothetical protein
VSAKRHSASARRRAVAQGRKKLFRLLLCEVLTISILISLAIFVGSGRFGDHTSIPLVKLLIVGAAGAVVILPMIFYRREEQSLRRER